MKKSIVGTTICALFCIMPEAGAQTSPYPLPLPTAPEVVSCLAGELPIRKTANGLEYCKVVKRQDTLNRVEVRQSNNVQLLTKRIIRVSNYSGHQLEDAYSTNRFQLETDGKTSPAYPTPWTRNVLSYFPTNNFPAVKNATNTISSGLLAPQTSSTAFTFEAPSRYGLTVFAYQLSGSEARKYQFPWNFGNPPVADVVVDNDTASAEATVEIISRSGSPTGLLCMQAQSWYVPLTMDEFYCLINGNRSCSSTAAITVPAQRYTVTQGSVITYDVRKATGGKMPKLNESAFDWDVDVGDCSTALSTTTKAVPEASASNS